MDLDMLLAMVGSIIMIAIVVIGTTTIVNRVLTFKERQLRIMAESTARQAAEFAAKSERVEQRLRVLERIATDRGADLATQIEDLRDAEPETERLQ